MTTTTARADTMRAADRLLVRAAGRVPGRLAAATVTSVAGAAVSLLVPATLATATDAVLAGRGVGTAGVTLVALLVVGAAADMLGGLASAGCVAGTTAWLRHRLVGHILAVGVSGVGAGGGSGRFAAGDLTSRLVGNSTEAAQVLPAAVRTAISFATSIGGVVALWLIDVRLAVALLFGVPVVVILIRLFTIQAADLFLRYQRIQGAIAGRLTDALAGARTIRAAGTTDREIARVLQPLPELAATGRATWGTQRQLVWRASLLLPVIEISVLAVAGYGVVAGRIAPGQLLAAAGYVALALSVLDQLDSIGGLMQARAGAGRIAEVLAVPAVNGSAADAALGPLPAGPGTLEFRDVTVHGADRPVLDRLTLTLVGGTSLAVVGRSGAGKTTLAYLVGRLIDPDHGEVRLDGVPLRSVPADPLRRQVAYAFERPALLGATVHDAIAYGAGRLSRVDVRRAAVAARADDFIRRLPHGYDTALADTPMSGGEAQRLGLARAVAQDARVLVLDDATSSLDTVTEVEVSTALADLRAGRTRLIVAHRPTTAARADLVAWLDGGRLRAVAPHERLWADPAYRAVFGAGTGAAADATEWDR